MLYDTSPKLLEALLVQLCSTEVTVGPRFSQQIAGAHSVPDGLIFQEPLAVFVETKLGSLANHDQLQRHCKTIVERLPGRRGSILISLTAGSAGQGIPNEVTAMAQEHSITVASITFGELVSEVAALPVTDLTLKETLAEFGEFIYGQGLVAREDSFMAAMLTGTSWRENLDHRVYYEPVDRSPKWRRASFLGLYHDKQVSHVGRIVAAVPACRGDTGEVIFDPPEMGSLNDAHRKAILNAIEAAQAYYPGFEGETHRFYVVDAFTPTDFRKTTPGGLMGHRYFDLEKIGGKRLPAHAPGSQAAQALLGHVFG